MHGYLIVLVEYNAASIRVPFTLLMLCIQTAMPLCLSLASSLGFHFASKRSPVSMYVRSCGTRHDESNPNSMLLFNDFSTIYKGSNPDMFHPMI